MLNAFRRTLLDLLNPRLTWTLVKAVALCVLVYAAVWGAAWWLIMRSKWADAAWLDHSLHALGGLGVMAVSLLLFPSCFVALQSAFLDGLADRIEQRHYPGMGSAVGATFRDGALMALKVMALMFVVNLIMLPVYILGSLFLGAGMAIFYAVNGWVCGREYYAQVALRHMSRGEVKRWTGRNAMVLWLAGTLITLLGTVPVLNLAAPVIGCAFMVHVARQLRPPDQTIQRREFSAGG